MFLVVEVAKQNFTEDTAEQMLAAGGAMGALIGANRLTADEWSRIARELSK
jgi:hypothetical protein